MNLHLLGVCVSKESSHRDLLSVVGHPEVSMAHQDEQNQPSVVLLWHFGFVQAVEALCGLDVLDGVELLGLH